MLRKTPMSQLKREATNSFIWLGHKETKKMYCRLCGLAVDSLFELYLLTVDCFSLLHFNKISVVPYITTVLFLFHKTPKKVRKPNEKR